MKLEVDINQTTANPLAQIVHRSRALEFAKPLGASVLRKRWVFGGRSRGSCKTRSLRSRSR